MTTPLPSTGELSLSQVKANMEITSTANISMGDPKFRALINRKTGQIKMSYFYGSNELELTVNAGEQDPPGTTAGFYRTFWGSLSQPNIDGIPVVGIYDAISENKFVFSLEGNRARSAFRSVIINNAVFYENEASTYEYDSAANTTNWTWVGMVAGLAPGSSYEFSYCTGPATLEPAPEPTSESAPPPAPTANEPAPTAPSSDLVATPTVASGQTLELLSGQTYYGTLDLNGKTDIKVTAIGQNGPAIITTGITIADSSWALYSGTIYRCALPAEITTTEKACSVNGDIIPLAHTNTEADPWTTGIGYTGGKVVWPTSLNDVVGCSFVFLANQSVASLPYRVTVQEGGTTLTVVSDHPDNASLFNGMQGYLQGALWMLEASTEVGFAINNGYLYVRAPGGVAPTSVVIANCGFAIDAQNSTNITLENVSVRDCGWGIRIQDSTNFKQNVGVGFSSTIRNCLYDGWKASGAKDVDIRNVTGRWFGTNGYHSWGMPGGNIENVHLQDVGNWGMPRCCYGGIYASSQVNVRIYNCSVKRCGYHGIAMMQLLTERTNNGSLIENCTVEYACLKLFDGGGIYLINRPKTPLYMTIKNCTVKHMNHHIECIGIYLDDHAPYVTVDGCHVEDCDISINNHDGRNNTYTNNTLVNAGRNHMVFAQTAGEGTVRDNVFRNNTVRVHRGEWVYNCETGNDNNQFVAPDYNTFVFHNGSNPQLFARTWTGSGNGVDHTFTGWRNFIQAGGTGAWDANSTISTA